MKDQIPLTPTMFVDDEPENPPDDRADGIHAMCSNISWDACVEIYLREKEAHQQWQKRQVEPELN